MVLSGNSALYIAKIDKTNLLVSRYNITIIYKNTKRNHEMHNQAHIVICRLIGQIKVFYMLR